MDDYYSGVSYPLPYEAEPESSGSWAGYLALFLILILIVAVIVYVIWNGTAAVLDPKWNIINSGTTTADNDSFTASAYSMYVVRTSSPTLTLSVRRPANATGFPFIIDNSKSGTEVTLAGGASGTIAEGEAVMFVWTTATEATRITG